MRHGVHSGDDDGGDDSCGLIPGRILYPPHLHPGHASVLYTFFIGNAWEGAARGWYLWKIFNSDVVTKIKYLKKPIGILLRAISCDPGPTLPPWQCQAPGNGHTPLTLAPHGSWSRDWIQGWAWPWPSWGHLGIRDLLPPSPAIFLLHLSNPNTSLVLHVPDISKCPLSPSQY